MVSKQMCLLQRNIPHRQSNASRVLVTRFRNCRSSSTHTVPGQVAKPIVESLDANESSLEAKRPFKRLSTQALVRSIVLGQIFKTPIVLKPGLWLLSKIAESKSSLLNADKNPLIRSIVLPLIYRHFCAGRNAAEVKQTISEIKRVGYAGVILCCSGEVLAHKAKDGSYSAIEAAPDSETTAKNIESWRDGQLATVNAVGPGDYVGVKYTGAGVLVSQALVDGKPPPPQMLEAIHSICQAAKDQKKRIWIDAEQRIFHPGIDNWTVDLMRKYNRDGYACIHNTIQAYLKSSRDMIDEHLHLAASEGWTLGIKLVRGAYIACDDRSKIHDTKSETDNSYNSIVHDIISKTWPGFSRDSQNDGFPYVHLFLAGHNKTSIRKATNLVSKLASEGKLDERVSYGQLHGMADDIGCELIALGGGCGDAAEQNAVAAEYNSDSDRDVEKSQRKLLLAAPKPYKCLTWGPIHDCLGYLIRRAVENKDAVGVERWQGPMVEMKKELWRRMGMAVGLGGARYVA